MNIESLLTEVDWHEAPRDPGVNSDLPYATHAGIFEIMGFKMRCYRLNTGEAVFDAGDFEAFFGAHIPDEDPECAAV